MQTDYRSASARPAPLLPHDPHALGRWRLLGRLGAGGMGTVYLARSTGGRTVALKVVHQDLADQPEFRARFREEVTATTALVGTGQPASRHFAAVVDADPDGPRPWLATEYLLALPLQEAVRRHGPWSVPAVRALGAALAEALAAVHRAGLVHRDVKPSNVLVTADGPRVIDFGIALASGAQRLTRTGYVLGSPAYMAPEQVTHQDAVPATDVFALAGVLVHAATGRGPFGDGAPDELLYRVLHEPPDLSALHDPEGVLRRALVRALARTPGERPTAAELGRLLSGGTAPFAALLPPPVLADLAARTTLDWDRPEPPAPPAPEDRGPGSGEPGAPDASKTPAPGTADRSTVMLAAADRPTTRLADRAEGPESAESPSAAGRTEGGAAAPPSRRRVLLAVGGALAAATAATATAYAVGRAARPTSPAVDPPGATPAPSASATAPSGAPGDGSAPSPRWEYRGNLGDLTRPALVGEVLVVGSQDTGEVLGVDTRRGTLRWSADGVKGYEPLPSGPTRQGPLVTMAALYASAHDRLAFVDPADGRTWYTEPLGLNLAALSGSPVVAADGPVVYVVGHGDAPKGTAVADRPRWLLAYQVDQARTLWKRQISPGDAGRVLGTVYEDRLIVLEPGSVRAYRTGDGAALWQRPHPGAQSWLTPAGDAVLVTGEAMALLDAATGAVRWTTGDTSEDDPDADDPLFGPAAVAGGTGYVTVRHGGLMAIDLASHQSRWSWLPEGGNPVRRAAPTVGGSLVFPPVASGNTVLVAVDTASGRTAWQLRDVDFSVDEVVLCADREHLYVTRGTHVRALPLGS